MRKAVVFFVSVLFPVVCFAQSRTGNGLSDAEKAAILAGAAQACHADEDKLINYEVIISRVLVNPTSSEAEETAVLTAYARKKFQVYNEQKAAPEMDCSEVLHRFDNLEIFKSVVFEDGTVKLPDGKIIKPKRPVLSPKSLKKGKTDSADGLEGGYKQQNQQKTESVRDSAVHHSSSPLKPFHPGVIVNSAAK